MSLGAAHRILVAALALFGACGLLASCDLLPSSDAALIAAHLLAIAAPESSRPWTRALAVALAGGELVRVALFARGFDFAIEALVALQIVRLATRRGATHDHGIAFLALAHLLAGTALGGGPGLGLAIGLALLVAPAALVLSHLRREVEGNHRQGARDRGGSLPAARRPSRSSPARAPSRSPTRRQRS